MTAYAAIAEYTETAGTGPYTLLGALPGAARLGAIVGSGAAVSYHITDGALIEAGRGTFSAPDILSRDLIQFSSNDNAPVDWATGKRRIVKIVNTDATSLAGIPKGTALAGD